MLFWDQETETIDRARKSVSLLFRWPCWYKGFAAAGTFEGELMKLNPRWFGWALILLRLLQGQVAMHANLHVVNNPTIFNQARPLQ